MLKNSEMIIDSFAGGGGASLGITWALGQGPDVAINHDAEAITMHAANHPDTQHFEKDVWSVSPHTVTKGQAVGLLWASPDCCHFSRAKGAKPVKKNNRSLAWVVVKWAAEVRPRVIILENVREFEDWGPLIPKLGDDGKPQTLDDGSPVLVPDPSRKGHSFKRWAGRLRNLGYDVQWRVLNAADYGAPTHRRRLFLVARCDGKPIIWPEPTHGDPKKLGDTPLFGAALLPWKTAAECIDWSIPCPSIFERKRPLAENTLRRIAMGIKRYVLENPKPFIVQVNHGGPEFRGQGVDEPLPTVTGGAGAKRPAGAAHAMGVVAATLIGAGGPSRGGEPKPIDVPMGTVISKDMRCVAAATLVQTGYTEREGQSPRCLDLEKPLGTVVGGGQKHAVVAATIIGAGGPAYAGKPRPVDAPNGTLLRENRQAVVQAFLAEFAHGGNGRWGEGVHSPEKPLGTVHAGGKSHGIVAANLVHLNHGEKQWNGVDEPLRTVTSGNHAALVYSFLVKYFGTAIGANLLEPMPTATGKDRFGLVTVNIAGEPYVIMDIGMRMLNPRELARAQGFPDDYVLTGSKSSQVARIGNSVCPVMAQVLCKANYQPAIIKKKSKVS